MKYLEHLDSNARLEVLALIAQASDHDGVPPVSEHVLLHLRHGGDKADRHIIATLEKDDRSITIGYAHLDLTDLIEGPSAELVIHPDHRNNGLGSNLLAEVTRVAGPRLRLWSHGDLPSARAITARAGFTRVRTVMQMRRSLNDPIPEIDPAFSIRNFLSGIDNEEWILLNNRTFAGHPEQGSWAARDLEIRMKEPWFDEKGFLLATVDRDIVAFCWTKIHGGHSHQHQEESETHDHDPMGEIYIMGVNPKYGGKGFGRAITIAGLKHMRYQGIFSAMLYVDALNHGAIKLYKELGFTEWGRDVLYTLDK